MQVVVFASLALFICIQAAPLEPIQYEDNPNYSFQYSVADPITGDTKSQQETRQGDSIQGQYSLVEPDGVTRTVNYFADDVGGFRAEVSKNAASGPAQVHKMAYVQPVTYVARPHVEYVHHPTTKYITAPAPSYYVRPSIYNTYAYPQIYSHQ